MLIVEILFIHQLSRMDWLNNLKQICELIPSKLLNQVSTQMLWQEVVENEFWCCRPCNTAEPVYNIGNDSKIFLVHFDSTLKQFRV
jgi:hypothetical protein